MPLQKHGQRTDDHWRSDLASRDLPVPIESVLQSVREHLEACPCSTDRFKLVLESLQAIEESLDSAPIAFARCAG